MMASRADIVVGTRWYRGTLPDGSFEQQLAWAMAGEPRDFGTVCVAPGDPDLAGADVVHVQCRAGIIEVAVSDLLSVWEEVA